MLNPFQVRVVAAWMMGYRRIALRAGWGCGKSRALGEIARLAGEQGTDVLWVTDSGPRIQTVVQPVCEELLRPAGWRYNSQKNCWTKRGTTIWLRSYFRQGTRSAEANSIEGVNVGLVLLDEAQVFRDDEVLRKLFGRARTGTVTPAIVMAGLPVWGAWWEAAADKMGGSGRILHGTSFDNLANLRPEWLADAPETLGRAEFEAMLLNKPQPPEGQIYDCWSPEPYPAGNVVAGWQWSPTMRTVWSIDPGSAKPSATLWAEDTKLRAWVLCAEVNPTREATLTPELAAEMCTVAWPRHMADTKPPGVRFLVDAAIADPNAKRRDRNRETGSRARSDIQILSEPPAGLGAPGQSGIGLRPYVLDGTMPDFADRNDVRAGIIRVRRAMETHKLLCSGEAWDAGRKAKGRSFAKSVVGYRRDAWGQPVRFEGFDDVMDTVRYLVRWPGAQGLWFAHAFDGARMVAAPAGNPYAAAMGDR